MEDCSFQTLYEGIYRYVVWLSRRRATGHVLMQPDELEGELWFEVTKGWLYYKDRELDEGQMLAVVRQMLSNRIGELVHKYHGTHRRVEVYVIDLSDYIPTEYDDEAVTSLNARDTLDEFISVLTEDEREIVEAIIYGDFRIEQMMRLKAYRRSYVFDNAVVSLDYRTVADALHLDVVYTRDAWKAIKAKWRMIYEG